MNLLKINNEVYINLDKLEWVYIGKSGLLRFYVGRDDPIMVAVGQDAHKHYSPEYIIDAVITTENFERLKTLLNNKCQLDLSQTT